MAKQVLSNLDFNSVSRAVNMLDPIAAQEPATKAYVDAAIEGLAWKDNVVCDATTNVTISAPGATINGTAPGTAGRVLLRGQTAPAENGTYVWNGAAVPMTRTADMSSSLEFTNAIVPVDTTGATWRQTAVAPTVGTTAIAFTPFNTGAAQATETSAGIAELATQAETDAGTDDLRIVTPLKLATYSGRAKKFAQAVGDGSATQYTITHNLGTLDVHVAVYRNSGVGDEVLCDVEHATTNTITLRFASAPTSNQFRVVVFG